ncbi:PAS domain-containing protein [Anabaena azotica]|uniref:PAS domain-containing protein n=1 Tax=Anabaena azotica TaxID=197653 RepID=UPI0039A53B1F
MQGKDNYQKQEKINSTDEEGMIFQLADTTLQACNAAAERIIGYKNEQILGKTPFKPPWQIVHEDGTIFTPETVPPIVALQTGKPCKNVIMGLYQPTGQLVWLLLNSQPLFQTNKSTPYAVVTTFTDITNVKLRQSRSDDCITNNQILIANWNPDQAVAISANTDKLNQSVLEPISNDRTKAFLSMQNNILELIATGNSLSEILEKLAQSIEVQLTDVFCSIMLLNDTGTKLYPSVSSSLPEKYIQALKNGVPVGADVGSCGTSAYTKQTVIVSDIASDRKWVKYRDLALANNLKACWSTPILDSQGHVLGTFALYYPTVRIPQKSDRQFIERASHLAGLAIERQRWQLALQQSEYQLRLMTETIPQQVWTAQPDGRVDYYNQRWCDFTGKTQEQLKTQGWGQIIHPEDLPKLEELWAKAVQTGSDYEVETRMLSGSGEYHWILGQARPLRNQQGQIVKWYGTNTDITDHIQAREALRESELNFRTLADTMPQIFWTARPDGWVDYYNQRWFEYTDMTLEESQGWGWPAILHPDDATICIDIWNESVRTGKNYQIEYRFRRASDGQYRWHLGRAFPLRNEKGQIIKWFGSCTDIDDNKRAEEALRNALQEKQAACEAAETANRVKDEFLAILSHELRTPLNPILGWSQLLKTGKLDKDKTEEGLKSIERNAKLQVDLIDDLLDVSRILQGKLTLNVTTVNLADIISAALETMSLAASVKEIAVQTLIEANIGKVRGDQARLQQIVWNLLSNAIKFTPQGGRVEVRLQQIGSMAHIIVSDQGKGINREFLPHIFEHFRQEDGSTTRKFGGLGLGLAIVRHLVELHGGTVEADSPGEGQGTTLKVILPLISSLPETVTNRKCEDVALSLKGIKILVVDDDADSLAFVKVVLELYEATVTTAASAPEALQIGLQLKPDILVSDIGMPEMDGYELLKTMRALSSDLDGQSSAVKGSILKAIALTAFAGELDQQQAMDAGFQLHIPKPVEPEALAAAIVQVLN